MYVFHHHGSAHLLLYLADDPGDRREHEIILPIALTRAAGPDLNEQGDVWAPSPNSEPELPTRDQPRANHQPLLGNPSTHPRFGKDRCDQGRMAGRLHHSGGSSGTARQPTHTRHHDARAARRYRTPRDLPLEPHRTRPHRPSQPRSRGQARHPRLIRCGRRSAEQPSRLRQQHKAGGQTADAPHGEPARYGPPTRATWSRVADDRSRHSRLNGRANGGRRGCVAARSRRRLDDPQQDRDAGIGDHVPTLA